MTILEDTRLQGRCNDIRHEYFRSVGVHWNRTVLYCGDYLLPVNQEVCIGTRRSIQELISDIRVGQMDKGEIGRRLHRLCQEWHISLTLEESIGHVICDDDRERFAEQEISDICFRNAVPKRVIHEFQDLYVKRHGFFHRELKRAQNRGIKLIILVSNLEGVTDINDLEGWVNPRLQIVTKSSGMARCWQDGQPVCKKVQKYPGPLTGEQLAKVCLALQEEYDVEFYFCRPEEAGRRILSLLNVNLKG